MNEEYDELLERAQKWVDMHPDTAKWDADIIINSLVAAIRKLKDDAACDAFNLQAFLEKIDKLEARVAELEGERIHEYRAWLADLNDLLAQWARDCERGGRSLFDLGVGFRLNEEAMQEEVRTLRARVAELEREMLKVEERLGTHGVDLDDIHPADLVPELRARVAELEEDRDAYRAEGADDE